MKFRFISTLLLLLTPSVHADTSNIESLIVNRADGSDISYYLLEQPQQLSDHVLLLIVQGSSCNSVLQIEPIFSDYKDVWPEADLLLIEKYAIDRKLNYDSDPDRKDCPDQYLEKDSPKQRITDIIKVLNIVRTTHKYSHFIVLGGSEGATVADLLAANIDDIDATISFSGGGRWFIDDVLYSIAAEYENNEQAQEAITGFKEFAKHMLNSEPFTINVSGHGYNWWHQWLSFDQFNTLQKVNSPLLIVQGGMDLSGSPKKVDEMILALQKSGKDNIEYLTYEKLDHKFNNTNGQSERNRVITDMRAWFKKKLNNASNK